MLTIQSASIWIKACTRWTPPPSTCACRCFPGPNSANTKAPSRCTRCSTCTAISPCDNQKALQVSHQQLHASGNHYRTDLQIAMAGRIVLQVDQAAPPNQGILRYQRERGQDPNLDRGVGLCAGSHRPQTPAAGV